MFFSQIVLAKRGPLGKIWLAGHWDKKLTKNNIFKTNIPKSIKHILNPHLPMALRMTSHLLLGVVRIFSKKVKYLLDDCTEAVARFKSTAQIAAPTISLKPEESEEQEDHTIGAISKSSNITNQIDDYLRAVDRLEDLVIDKFYQSKNFQDIYEMEMSKQLPSTIQIIGKDGKLKTIPTPSKTPLKPGQQPREEEEEEEQDLSIYTADGIDIEIEEELRRFGQLKQDETLFRKDFEEKIKLKKQYEDEYTSWVEKFHPDELKMRGEKVVISLTPSSITASEKKKKSGLAREMSSDEESLTPSSPFQPFIKPTTPKESEYSPFGTTPVGIADQLIVDKPFDPNELYIDFDELQKGQPTIKDDVLTEDGDILIDTSGNLGVVFDNAREYYDHGGGGIETEYPLPEDTTVKTTPTGPEEKEGTEETEQPKSTVKNNIPDIGVYEKSEQQQPTRKPVVDIRPRSIRQKSSTLSVRSYARPKDLFTTRSTLPASGRDFKLKVLPKSSILSPKQQLLSPIRQKMSERILNYIRDVLQSKYPIVLVEDEVKLLDYLKVSKINEALKNQKSMGGLDFTTMDQRVRDGLGLPQLEAGIDVTEQELREQVILSKVQSRLESTLDISPTKRRKQDTTITKEEEERLLSSIHKEWDGLWESMRKQTSPSKSDSPDRLSIDGYRPIGPSIHIDLFKGVPPSPVPDYGDYNYPPHDDGGGPIESGGFEVPLTPEHPPPKDKTWTPRTESMHKVLNNFYNSSHSSSINFFQMVKGHKQSRTGVAGTFYELLVLKTKGLIQVEQETPYGDIAIKKTANFYHTSDWRTDQEPSHLS